MPDRKEIPRAPRTPVPTGDLVAWSKTVVRIESGVNTIKDDLLPPVARDSREARDGVMQLNGRVTALESRSDHECTELDRQARQDTDIADLRPKIDQTGRLVWWIIGLIVVVGGGAFAFAMTTQSSATANSTRINSQALDISRHERKIESLEKAQQQDRETYLRELRQLPQKVKQAARPVGPTVEDVNAAASDLPLTSKERIQLHKILESAKRRSDSL